MAESAHRQLLSKYKQIAVLRDGHWQLVGPCRENVSKSDMHPIVAALEERYLDHAKALPGVSQVEMLYGDTPSAIASYVNDREALSRREARLDAAWVKFQQRHDPGLKREYMIETHCLCNRVDNPAVRDSTWLWETLRVIRFDVREPFTRQACSCGRWYRLVLGSGRWDVIQHADKRASIMPYGAKVPKNAKRFCAPPARGEELAA
jgi:hypothetical protein